MSNNVKLFRSIDIGSPSITGQVGGLIPMLDSVLVNGYNSLSCTLSRSAYTVTVTATNHGFKVGQCILISGADQLEYNSEFYINAIIDSNTFTFMIQNTPVTPATGTIICKIAPLGWTKVYSGTNLAAYRAPGGNRAYLRVDDTNTLYCKVRGYLNMTDVNTGTDMFPTNEQLSNGIYWIKSNSTIDATSKVWNFVGNDRTFYIQILGTGTTASVYTQCYGFGEFKSYKINDGHNILLIGNDSNSYATPFMVRSDNITATGGTVGHYVCRNYTGLGGSTIFSKHGDNGKAGTTYSGSPSNFLTAFPNPVDGNVYMSPFFITETASIRGELAGIHYTPHASPLSNGDIFEGSGNLAGKSFMVWRESSSGAIIGEFFIEISNTWIY